jgi:hypothetical protein
MTHPLTCFLLGFLAASAIAAALAIAYYLRARRRVKLIVSAIERCKKAQEVVTPAIDRAYAPKP